MRTTKTIIAVMLLCAVLSDAAYADGPLTLIKTIAVDPEGVDGAVDGCEFSKDGFFFAASDNHGVARIFLTADCFSPGTVLPIGKVTHFYHDHTCADRNYELNATIWSHDGQYFATGRNDDGLKVWRTDSFFDPADFATNDTPQEHLVNGTETDGADFSPNNLWVATAADKNLIVFRLSDFTQIATVNAGDGAVNSVDFSPDSSLVAFGASNAQVKIITTSNWSIIQPISSTNSVKSVRFSPDGQYLAYSGRDQRCKVYRTSDWSLVVDIIHSGNEQALPCDDDDSNAAVEAVEWSSDSVYLLTSGLISGQLHVWDTSVWPASGSITLGSDDALAIYQAQEAKRQIEFIDVFENLVIVGGDEGNVRVYEFAPKPIDFNRDGWVDMTDFSRLAQYFRQNERSVDIAPRPLGDGIIDFNDLSLLLGYWLTDPSLLGYWTMDETAGSTAGDYSPYGRNGTLVNMDDTDWVPGKLGNGNALEFDGIDDFVEITGFPGVLGGQSRTTCAWIKTTTTGIIMNWGPAGPGDRWTLYVDANGHLTLGVGGGAIVGTAVVDDGGWHHVAAVLTDDGSPNINELILYVDGLPDEPSSTPSDRAIDTQAGPDVTIGQFLGGGFFNGTIDEVRIYDRALGLTQIRELVGLSPIPEGVWSFDDGSGATASDSSGTGRDGTLVNMDDTDWVLGKVGNGNALEFDGVDDFVEITGFTGLLGGQSRTVCAWIRTNTPGGAIIAWGYASAGNRWTTVVDSAGHLRLAVGGGAIVGSAPLSDGSWHHVAVVAEDDGSPNINEVKLYVDGLPDTPSSNTSDRLINTLAGSNVKIGEIFQGTIDEVRIYDRALSAEEIGNLASP